jgi:hypothetical protein
MFVAQAFIPCGCGLQPSAVQINRQLINPVSILLNMPMQNSVRQIRLVIVTMLPIINSVISISYSPNGAAAQSPGLTALLAVNPGL